MISLILLIITLIAPINIAIITFILFCIRVFRWLFCTSQDMLDDYYYERYENAKRRYNEK